MSKRTVGLIVRIAVSAALLAFILSLLDLSQLRDVVAKGNVFWIAAALGVFVTARLIMARRWQVILRRFAIRVGFGEITWITFVSASLSSLVPGGLGSDIFRGVQIVRKYGKLGDVTSSILIDRVIGIYATVCLGTFGALLALAIGVQRTYLLTFAVLHAVIIGGWMLGYWISRRVDGLSFGHAALQRYWSGVVSIAQSITDFDLLRRIFLAIFTSSVAVQLCRCLIYFCLYRAYGVAIDPIYFIVFIPLIFLATQIPISISGLGITEGMLIFLFTPLGAPSETSFAVGISSYGVLVLFSAGVVVAWLAAGVGQYVLRELTARRSGQL